jgi:hypothetical protein
MYSNSASYLEVGYLETTTMYSLEAVLYEKGTKDNVRKQSYADLPNNQTCLTVMAAPPVFRLIAS